MDYFIKFIDYIPFVGLAAGNNTIGSTPIITRLLEAGIIGIVAGFISVKVSTSVMENDMRHIMQKLESIEQEQRQVRRDLYRPFLQQQ
jgi:hypothetical protein